MSIDSLYFDIGYSRSSRSAITHGMSHLIGSIAEGQLADLVLWRPENFGSRPELILKSGVIAWAQMGDANASIPTVQPVLPRPMWGASPASAALNSVSFVSQISLEQGIFYLSFYMRIPRLLMTFIQA